MKYMGSKSRIAKEIIPILQNYIDKCNIDTYLEPFVGGANIIDKIQCKNKIGTDLNQYLIALLNRVKERKDLYQEVPRDLYNDARKNLHTGKYEDWELGNIGFLASYNGRFFDGGFAKPGYEKTKNGSRYRDYYKESMKNILLQQENIQDVIFECYDYIDLFQNKEFKNCLIYCDPPYKGVKEFKNSKSFDHALFWDKVRELSFHNIVIISELQAPDDFICIWEKKVSRSIKAKDKSKASEKLFIHKYAYKRGKFNELNENLEFLFEMNKNQDYYYKFSINLFLKCKHILSNLKYSPFISPTGCGSIQFEFDNHNNNYLELEIFEDKIEVYMEYANEKKEEKKLEGDDFETVFQIINSFMEK